MKLLIAIRYEMTLAKIIKIETSICKDNSIQYWSKRKKKTLLHYFDTKTKQIYIKKYIPVARLKMANI